MGRIHYKYFESFSVGKIFHQDSYFIQYTRYHIFTINYFLGLYSQTNMSLIKLEYVTLRENT